MVRRDSGFDELGLHAKVKPIANCDNVIELFARGVRMEEHPSTHDEAIRTYLQVLEIEPDHAATHINLGHALLQPAGFRLRPKSIIARRWTPTPATLWPTSTWAMCWMRPAELMMRSIAYRDSHPTGAYLRRCALQSGVGLRTSAPARQALPHWKAYLKLDSTGPWAVHARNQIARILEADKLKIVYRRG